jgi:hypothetical protein
MKDNTCNRCRFWMPRVTRSGTGECRRMPPLPAFEPQGGMGRVSPVTGAYFWCGEFKASGGVVVTGQDAFAGERDAPLPSPQEPHG